MPDWILPAVQGVVGLGQAIFGGAKARKAQKQLENIQSPQYSANQGILNFYNQALARYNVNPTETALYKRQMQGIDRGVAQGIAGLQDRRSGVSGLSSLVRAGSDAKLDANVAAENQRDQRFSQLGQAAGMKASEESKAFDINQWHPYERKYNLLSQKAGAANQTANAGMQNLFGGLQSWGQMNMMDKYYGSNTNSRGGGNKQSSGGNGFEAVAGTYLPRISQPSPATQFGNSIAYRPLVQATNYNSPASVFGNRVRYRPLVGG